MNDTVTVETPVSADAVEAAADGAVAIAEIEAARDVEITKIQTASNEAQTEAVLADAEAARQASEEEDDIAWLRDELDGLRMRCETHEAAYSSLEAQFTILAAQQAEMTAVMTRAALTNEPVPEQTPPADQTPPLDQSPPPSPLDPPESPGGGDAGAPGEKVASRKRRWL